jgi:hypothetical protein
MNIKISCPKCGRAIKLEDVESDYVFCPNKKCCDTYGQLRSPVFTAIYGRGWKHGQESKQEEIAEIALVLGINNGR